MPDIFSDLTASAQAEQAAGTYAPPTYQYAGDNHNYGNGNFAVTDPTTWGTGVGNAGKFIVSSVASGINGFYNTGVAVSNWFGADAKENDVADQLGQIDDDLGNYYRANRQSADTAGFILGSFVPGLGGVKLLNAGQRVLRTAAETGIIGGNTAKIVGLLAPQTERYLNLAKADIAATNATYSALSANTLKAVGAGYGQAALEAAAFQVAVTATSFKSPVLDQADGWDMAKDLVTGTLVGGAIGGALTHAVGFGAIKKAVKGITPEEALFTGGADIIGLSPAQRIISRNSHIDTMPVAPSATDLIDPSSPFAGVRKLIEALPAEQQAGYAQTFATKFSRLRTETLNSMQNANRSDIHALMAGNDPELGNLLADSLQGTDGQQTFANFHNLTEIGRLDTKMKAEAEITKFNKEQLKQLPDISADISGPPKKIGYVKLSGEGTGDLSFTRPSVSRISDIAENSTEATRMVNQYNFKATKPWSAIESADPIEADARYIWASKTPALENGVIIGQHDIPLIEKAVLNKLDNINVRAPDGSTYPINTFDDIVKHLEVSKNEVAQELIGAKKAGVNLTMPQIADIVNVKQSYLLGEHSTNSITKDIFARQQAQDIYAQDLKSKGLWKQSKEDDFNLQPTYMKTAYTTDQLTDNSGNILSGMAALKAQQKVYMSGINGVVADHMPVNIFNRYIHPSDDLLRSASREGAGPGLVTMTSGGYGSLASIMENNGAATAAFQKSLKDVTSSTLESSLYKIAQSQDVAIGFESINKFIQSTSEQYGLNAAGTGIEPLKMLDWKAAVAAGSKEGAPALQEGAPLLVPIEHPDVLTAWTLRTNLTGARTQAFSDLRNAQGLEDMKDPRALRPIRPDPKDFPHFAMVVDPTITGVGQKSMIHAATAKDLEAMIDKVPNRFDVFKKSELEDYFKAHGEFDYEQTLHENYIDSSLKSAGVSSPFFMRTDPQKIAESLIRDHLRSDDIFARELVNAKFEPEFQYLRDRGEQFTSAATSKFTGSFRDLESVATNPYTSYIKTALNVTRMNEHPYLMGLNNMLDAGVSSIHNAISDAFSAARSPAELDTVNNLLDKYGVSSAYRDAATDALANHSAPKGDLVRFISKANSILSTLTTRLDPLNAINNAIGATVLYGSETNSFLKSMQGVNPDIAGALGGMLKTPVPGVAAVTAGATPDVVNSAGKLMVQAIKNWTNPEAATLSGEPLKAFYARNGWSTRLTDQFHSVLENLTLQGTEDVGTMNGMIQKAFSSAKELAEKGEVLSGNKYAEEFNRFVAADTMRQMTDLGVQAGRITPEEQLGYINSFVNRTQGNILASQRPLIFQGPIGQAVGLFQSFQFNTMQQLFRHVAEGAPKDAAMMLGLQGTMYGMNGLPAFNFLNTHILGTASGNPAHQDLYTGTYGMAGKTIGDMLLYGIPSNMMRSNLYSRGDINPRQLTVIPVNPMDIPFVNATAKLYDNVKEMTSKMAGGGQLWESFLQGVEHNGISRPLAGVSQILQAATHGGEVFSTTGKGSIAGANDLMSWASAIRLAGGKPFDEAVANDAVFRISSYQAADHEKMKTLDQTIASTVLAGDSPSPDQINTFSSRYAALGGKTSQFNKYMMKTIMNANTPQANKIVEALKNPYSQKMQEIMGGAELLDGRSQMGTRL
jgi:hypothetical protein